MTPANRLLRLVDYDYWANLEIASSIEKNTSFDNRNESVTLFAHITATPVHWLARIEGVSSPGVDLWPEQALSDSVGAADDNLRHLRALIEASGDNLDRMISYTNSSGISFDSLLSDILHHLVIHGQHHRSQIALLLRQDGIVPPQTDFIAFTRKG